MPKPTDKHKREGFHMVRIPADLYAKLAILAAEDSRTTNAYIVLKLKQLTEDKERKCKIDTSI